LKRGAGLVILAVLAAAARGQDITPESTFEVQRLLLAADPPGFSMPIWSSRKDTPPPSYDRSPFVWTGSKIDLTGKAVWNSRTHYFGTTAISPLHVIYAHHAGGTYPAGTIVRFVTIDDTPVERRVKSSVRIGASDIDLSTFDAPLPVTIHWYKVMPEHWFLHASRQAPGTSGRLPCLVMDGNTQCISVKDIMGFSPGLFATEAPVDPRRRAFARDLYSGDSGSPMFILVGGELVLDGIYHTAQGGPEVSEYLALLDAAMEGSGFRVTVAELSALRMRR
jgi:hypothetical protein